MTQAEEMREHLAEPLHVGSSLGTLEFVVSAEKMKTAAALLADPNPIHFDSHAVKALGLGDKVVNQGPLNMGYVMNLLAAFSGSHNHLRHFKVRFLGNVFAGDRVRATGTVTAIRSETDTKQLRVECEVELIVHNGPSVLQGTAVVMVPSNKFNLVRDPGLAKGHNH